MWLFGLKKTTICCSHHLYRHGHWGCVKTSKKKLERAGSGVGRATEEVHLSDRLRRITDRLCRPIGLQIFRLGRFRVSGGFSLRGAGGVWKRAGTGLIRVSLLWHCSLGFSAVRGGSLKGSGGLVSASCYRSSTVKDLSLRGCGEDSVRGQGGGLWRFAMVWREFGLVARLRFGFVLERQ